MADKDIFNDVSKLISVLNKHMDEKLCEHDLKTVISEVFDS
jgi:hypothetical protein